MNFIPEDQYQIYIKQMPIFCIDFLIRCRDKILLLKRKEEPLKDNYWIIGGRLLFHEKIDEAAKRIQMREIGKYFKEYKIIGFSNFFYTHHPDSRATHTPTLLCEINVEETFIPKFDASHSDYKWSNDLPEKMKSDTILFFQ